MIAKGLKIRKSFDIYYCLTDRVWFRVKCLKQGIKNRNSVLNRVGKSAIFVVTDDTLRLSEKPIVTRLKLFVAAKLRVSGYILLVDHESTMITKLGVSP